VSPGRLSAQPWCLPVGRGAAARSVDRQIGVSLVVLAELPALAPGARCPRGRSVGSGAPAAVQWTATLRHARNVRDPSRVLEQEPDRQRAPRCCSGGVSSIRGASESRCSHNRTAQRCRQGLPRDRHRSSPAATGVHEGASPLRSRPSSGAGNIPSARRLAMPSGSRLVATTARHWPTRW
jgi:hypothetical protein